MSEANYKIRVSRRATGWSYLVWAPDASPITGEFPIVATYDEALEAGKAVARQHHCGQPSVVYYDPAKED